MPTVKIRDTPALIGSQSRDAERKSKGRLTLGSPMDSMARSHCTVLSVCLKWMEACLEEDLPPTTELEEGLRNGIYLGKLAIFFAPKMVSQKKLYDRDQTRYKKSLKSAGDGGGTLQILGN
ncbi:hypothetical protein CRUP_029944 [Coryphaenoides rupestris]|nr:hypothetical protein CRUP_029944 [Coryphaenoides rupestris]